MSDPELNPELKTNLEPELSPLAQANPESLAQLMANDPLGYTKADRAIIIAELRRDRARWLEAESQGKKRLPKAKAKVEVKSLADLGL